MWTGVDPLFGTCLAQLWPLSHYPLLILWHFALVLGARQRKGQLEPDGFKCNFPSTSHVYSVHLSMCNSRCNFSCTVGPFEYENLTALAQGLIRLDTRWNMKPFESLWITLVSDGRNMDQTGLA